MKRLLLLLFLFFFALLTVLVIRAAAVESRQIAVPSAAPVEIDRAAALARFSRAIRFQTVSLEAAEDGPLEYAEFIGWLVAAYPEVHEQLRCEVIDGRSLLYTWTGTDPTLPAIVLMGHYDVVPIEPGTERRWSHPPFGGIVADGFVWGRGTLDDKISVIGLLEAASALTGEGFRPQRTIYFSFGHDEEVGGERGAAVVARLLSERGVAVDAVVDEGGVVMADGLAGLIERPVALVGVAEKGAASIELRVRGSGGHSSMPPRRTEIGAIAAAVDRVQRRPLPARLEGATAEMFRWLAPEAAPIQRLVLSNLWLFEPLLDMGARRSDGLNAMLRTTTAPTMIEGGVKANVIPSHATAVVNFRILPGDTIDGVVRHVRRALDDDHVELRVSGESRREPSAVSDVAAPQFRALQKTIGEIFPEAVVAPYLVVGGTDARYFRGLTANIYRFGPVALSERDLQRAHGIDERIGVDQFFLAIQFYRALIVNMSRVTVE